jgi:hypothetical protein
MNEVSNPWLSQPVASQTRASTESAVPSSAVAHGPRAPQRGIPVPDRVDQLPTRDHQSAADLWLLGAHGGAGESSLSELVPQWRPSGHSWPRVPGHPLRSRVLLTARSNVRGLRAAQSATTQWAAGLAPFVDLVGLVIVADAPGKTPRPIRELMQLVSGGAPRTWHVPWIESWRLGDPVALESAPRPVRRLVDDLQTVLASGATGTSI